MRNSDSAWVHCTVPVFSNKQGIPHLFANDVGFIVLDFSVDVTVVTYDPRLPLAQKYESRRQIEIGVGNVLDMLRCFNMVCDGGAVDAEVDREAVFVAFLRECLRVGKETAEQGEKADKQGAQHEWVHARIPFAGRASAPQFGLMSREYDGIAQIIRADFLRNDLFQFDISTVD